MIKNKIASRSIKKLGVSPKITRYNGDVKAFGINAGAEERFVFGTDTVSDDLTDNLNSIALGGWNAAVAEGAYPPEQWFNAQAFINGQFIAYLHQMGVAEYNASQTYYTDSFCNYNGILYQSLIDSNVGVTPGTDNTKWKSIYLDAALLGTPTAPTPPIGDNSTKIATTEFVAANGGMPVGAWCYYDGYALPAGFLWRDGSAVSRTTYSLLYAASILTLAGTTTNGSPIITGISSTAKLYAGQDVESPNFTGIVTIVSIDSGTQITVSANATVGSTVNHVFHLHGAGDGSTTFNVGDGRGRSPMGAGQGTGLTNRIQGQILGLESEAISLLQMTPHVHPYKMTDGGQPSGREYAAAAESYLNKIDETTSTTGGGNPIPLIHPVEVAKSIVRYG